MNNCTRESTIDGTRDSGQLIGRDIDNYKEANQPAVCHQNRERNENEFLQIAENCRCPNQQYCRRKQQSEFYEALLNLIEILSKLWRNGCTATQRRRTGLSRPHSYLIPLLVYATLIMTSPSYASYYSDYVSLYLKNLSRSACDGEYLRIACPEGTSIDVQGAMYGRKVSSREMCPSKQLTEGSGIVKTDVKEDTNCEAKAGAECQDQRICRLLVHRRVFGPDPCPGTSKYLTVTYQCAPKDFRQQEECTGEKVLLRCRQDTVISLYKVISNTEHRCRRMNTTDCSMTEKDVFDEVSSKCHSTRRCYYTLPAASCFNRITIMHTCVPKQFLTSELPTSKRLYTTTTATTRPTTVEITSDSAETTEYSTREQDSSTTVQPTVNTDFDIKGEPTRNSTTTSKLFVTKSATAQNRSKDIQDNAVKSAAGTQPDSNSTSFIVVTGATRTSNSDHGVIIFNEFPPESSMGDEINITLCPNCSDGSVANSGGDRSIFLRIYIFLKEYRDDILIALLLGLVVALLLVICILVFRRKKKAGESKEQSEPVIARDIGRNSREEHDVFLETEAPNQEDEHDNMSALGSMLQRSFDSNHVSPRPKINFSPEVEEENEFCGPNSIFAKICCNCCCNNAPWQRARGGTYKVKHHSSSTAEDVKDNGHYRSHETFPVFGEMDDDVDNRSPIPVLEDHVNRTEYPIVSSESAIETNMASQQSSDFRPISSNAQRQYSVTPEPDLQYRIQRSTFHPHGTHETQRSDPALNRYNVRTQHHVTQPLTAPTSPVINHSGNHTQSNGTHKLVDRGYPPPTLKTLPVMGQSMLQTQHQPQTPQSPIILKYTPTPTQYYPTQQYPTFTDAIEQYDNAMPQPKQMVVRRKQYPPQQRTPQEYHAQTNQFHFPRYNGNYPGYHLQTSYEGDHFVQAVPRTNLSSTARAIELPATSRTIDLSHDNSLSRNSWLEIRRSSVYDNSLPRNSEMYDIYQQQLHQQEMQHALQHELPGSRNLNHYYP